MGTLTETAIGDYRLSFADQGKQTSIFHFCLQQTNGSCFFLSVPLSIYGDIETLNKDIGEL
jgi:hypothetical protein